MRAPSSSRNDPCSIEATPARTASLIPSVPCACAATFLSSLFASSTSAFNSSKLYCVAPTASPSDSTPPVAQVLITSAPYLICSRTAWRICSGPSATPSMGPSCKTPGRKPFSSQCPPVMPIAWPAVSMPGPRMETAGPGIGITGGHCDENGFRPGVLQLGPRDGVAVGPEQIRQAVRLQIKYGADVIKTCATGGVLSEGDAVGATQYSFEELKALVDEANKLDRKVAAHAHGTEGIKLAVRAGVASIEHGSFLDEEGARMMVERGTFLVPTLSAAEAVERAAKTGVLKGLRAEKALAAASAVRRSIKLAVASKIQIALGTDAGVIVHGTNAREFFLMCDWGGMTPMESIMAGTMGGAKLFGLDKNLGSTTVGKWADIVAVSGEPLKEIQKMEKGGFVVKNGGVYRKD